MSLNLPTATAGRLDVAPARFRQCVSWLTFTATFFPATAANVGAILERAGHGVVLQQWDFANRNFMERMDAALSSGARVIALLSNEHLASKHCEAEWLNAIANDPRGISVGWAISLIATFSIFQKRFGHTASKVALWQQPRRMIHFLG